MKKRRSGRLSQEKVGALTLALEERYGRDCQINESFQDVAQWASGVLGCRVPVTAVKNLCGVLRVREKPVIPIGEGSFVGLDKNIQTLYLLVWNSLLLQDFLMEEFGVCANDVPGFNGVFHNDVVGAIKSDGGVSGPFSKGGEAMK